MSAARDPGTETPGLSTRGVSAGYRPERPGDPVAPPLIPSATFRSGDADAELLYTRYGNNPAQRDVARKLAALEDTEDALVLGSGMAAIAMTALALVEAGGHILASRHLYGATRSLFLDELPRRGIGCTLVDPDEPGAWERGPDPSLVYVEMPTNPTLRIPDPVPALERARAAGVPAVIDATFASPIHLRAHALGFDVIIHSATKYLGGHSDLIGGVVAGPSALVGRVNAMMRLYGPSADPHMVWLLDRGLRTLDVRMRRHDANARAVAAFLDGHPAVETAIHPSLPHHPDHARARQLLPEGTGGMVSFVLRGGASAAERFMAALRWIHEAPSLGGVESLASEPRRTSHASMTPRQRAEAGIPDGFIRLSIGIEDEADLIEDLDAALAASRR